jgi:hypothetical protein
MTSSIDTFPDYRMIDTPWEPAPIAWRFQGNEFEEGDIIPDTYTRNSSAAIAHILGQVGNPSLTHLVREVDVVTRRGISALEMHPDETWEDLALVDEQFKQLEALTDLRVAPTQWHVFQDERGLTRTIARVSIIDGYSGILPDIEDEAELDNNTELSLEASNILRVYLRGLTAYYDGTIGRPLNDIDRITQFKYGAPRVNERLSLGNSALYLVDIEPSLEMPYSRDRVE